MPVILTKKSDTPGSIPSTANLTNLAGGAELAVNTADKRLFSMNSSSAVIEVGTNPSSLTCADASFTVARVGSLTISSLSLTNATFTSATITNLTSASTTISSALTLSGGTANGVLYLNGSKVATSGSALTFDGSGLGINMVASEGGVTPALFAKQNSNGAFEGLVVRSSAAGGEILAISYDGSVFNHTASYVGSGGYVPLAWTVSGSEAMRLTSTGLGIGTSSPVGKLDVVGSSSRVRWDLSNAYVYQAATNTAASAFAAAYYDGSQHLWLTSSSTRMTLDSSGNLGLGVTPSAWGSSWKALQLPNGPALSNISGLNALYLTNNAVFANDQTGKYIASDFATLYQQYNGEHRWSYAASGTAGNTITFTRGMTLDASGRLGIGTTSPASGTRLHMVDSAGCILRMVRTSNRFDLIADTDFLDINARDSGTYLRFLTADTERARITSGGDIQIRTADSYLYSNATSGGTTIDCGFQFISSTKNLTFWSNNAERARINSGGDFFVAKTADTLSAVGHALLANGAATHTRSGEAVLYINRLASDGDLVVFYQDTTQEGSISVSGNTVSYNAFAGSHWSQLQDGSKPDILRGTVMESINELCVWPDEQNERLPKSKVSDTVGSKKVYGVFMAWDNDWSETNDMYVTAVGAFICRVNGSVTVQEGDLLESNGDGTARVQADDIIRSSTIGKVTSTIKTHEYDDGSYCVPTVLYCG